MVKEALRRSRLGEPSRHTQSSEKRPSPMATTADASDTENPRAGTSRKRTVRLRYGDGAEELALEAERVIFEIGPRRFPALEDPAEELRFSLRDPIGPGLSEVIDRGDRVLLVTVDRTRPSPKALLPPVREALEDLGATVTVMAANGLHRWMSGQELEAHYGSEEVVQHDCDGEMLSLGETTRGTPIELSSVLRRFDKVVTLGFVEPQYLMGFGGGRKLLFPGLGSRRAIALHHLMLAESGFQLGRLEGNPLHEDVMEMVDRLGVWPDGPFAASIDVVLNPDDSSVEIFSGDPVQAHLEACRLAGRINTVRPAGPCDICIVSPGGYPYDRDLVQSRKALISACRTVRSGGVIVLLAECREGWAADEGSRPMLVDSSPKEIIAEMNARYGRRAELFREPDEDPSPCTGALVLSFLMEFGSLEVIVVSELEGLDETFLLTAGSLAEAMEIAEARVSSLSSVGIIHNGRRLIIP